MPRDLWNRLPPAEDLSRFLKLGVDLVAFSGGKNLRGPQCTGLLLGRADLEGAVISLDAGATRRTTVTLDEPGTLTFICHLPGHEAYGMTGTLVVTPR